MEEVYANSYRSDNQDGVMVEWSQNCIKTALSNSLSTFRLILLMAIDIEGPPLRKFDFNVAYKEYSCFKNSLCYKQFTYQCKGKDGMKLFYPNFLI